MSNTVEFLKQVKIFSLLAVQDIESIINHLNYIDVEEGELLFNEGDDGNTLFIVESGKIAGFVLLPNGIRREIAEFAPGDFLGEMSIFENAPRSATCYAKEKTRLLSLLGGDFFEFIDNSPSIAMKIMYRMLNITTRRLREKSEFLADMVVWGEEARKRAITDELTGVYNRRFLDESLQNHFRIAIKKKISLVMADLDNFRRINEHYSHKAGDRVLVGIIPVFKEYLRKKDILARYGGDEFNVIMPETDLEEAKGIAEKICAEVAGLDLLKGFEESGVKVTISLGIASYPESADSLPALRSGADRALYEAKSGGRNRVVCGSSKSRPS